MTQFKIPIWYLYKSINNNFIDTGLYKINKKIDKKDIEGILQSNQAMDNAI